MIPKIIKFVVIVLLVAVCYQVVLCDGKPLQFWKSDTKSETVNDVSECLPTLFHAPLIGRPASVSEIPVLSLHEDTEITGERGKISVDGVVFYRDQELMKGSMRFKMTNGRCVYINGRLVARNLSDDILLPTAGSQGDYIYKFHIRIKLGDYIKIGRNGRRPGFWLRWIKLPSKEEHPRAKDAPKCTRTLDGAPSVEPPMAAIPSLSTNKEMAITGENGKIRVNGVVLYNDEELKKGNMRFELTKQRCVYLNGKLVARNFNDYIPLPSGGDSYINTDKFDIRIKLGDYIKIGRYGREPQFWLEWWQPKHEWLQPQPKKPLPKPRPRPQLKLQLQTQPQPRPQLQLQPMFLPTFLMYLMSIFRFLPNINQFPYFG